MWGRAAVLASLVASSGAVACARERADVETICAASPVRRAGETNEWPAIDRAIDALPPKMRTADGRRVVEKMRESSADPAMVLDAAAKRVGLSACSFADALRAAEDGARYRHDVEALCAYGATAEAGALLTNEGRALRDRLAALPTTERSSAMRAEAARVGLAGCAAANEK